VRARVPPPDFSRAALPIHVLACMRTCPTSPVQVPWSTWWGAFPDCMEDVVEDKGLVEKVGAGLEHKGLE